MELKINYQYSYFIHPFVIKETKYQKYLLKILKDKRFELKVFQKSKDLNLYQYFLPKVQEFLFSSFGFSEAKKKKLEEHGFTNEDAKKVPLIRRILFGRTGKLDLSIVEMITGKDLKEKDVLIGIASSGVHSNGFSLVRKVFSMDEKTLNTYHEELGKTLGEALIAPTKIYVKALRSIKEAGVRVKGCSHITGGGFYENVPRMLPEGVRAVIRKDSYEVPAIFKMLAREGQIEEQMMYNTYNMGIGMMLALDPKDAEKAIEALKAVGEEAYVVGSVEAGEKGVTLC